MPGSSKGRKTKKFSDFERAMFLDLWNAGNDDTVIAHALGRSYYSVAQYRRRNIGLLPTPPWPAGILMDDDVRERLKRADARMCISSEGYVWVSIAPKQHDYLHRIVLGAKKGQVSDHLNGDRLDCRRENLRLVDLKINATHKTRLMSTNTSGYRGVSFIPAGRRFKDGRGRWLAQAQFNGKNHFLGYHDTAEDAAAVAKAWRLEHMEGALS